MIVKKISRAKRILFSPYLKGEPFNNTSKIIVPTTSDLVNPWDHKLKSLYEQEKVFNKYGTTTEGKTQTFLSKAVDKNIVLVSCLAQEGNDTKFNFNAFEKGVLSSTNDNEALLLFMRIFFRKQCVYGNYKDFDNLMSFLYSSNRKITLAYSENGHYSNDLCGWPSDFEEDARESHSAFSDEDS